MVRRLPFKRGFNNKFRIEYQEVRLDRLAGVVDDGAVVTPAMLVEVGLIRNASEPVVVLGNGEAITKHVLKTGDLIRIGQTSLQYTDDDTVHAAAK